MANYTGAKNMTRPDERAQVLENPYWFTSKEIDFNTLASGSSALAGVVKTFPAADGKRVRVLDMCVEVTSAVSSLASAAHTITAGYGNLASSDPWSSSAATVYSYVALVTVADTSNAFSLSCTFRSSVSSAAAPAVTLTPSDGASSAVTPCLYIKSTTKMAAKGRVHALLTRLPSI